MTYNATFKRPPPDDYYGRSPSPPRRYVEPLSPAKSPTRKPAPIEPCFNYPATNHHVDFTVRPDQPFSATPTQRHRSSSHKSGHHRTPSTIDTLAEAALAGSPAYQTHGSPPYSTHNVFVRPQPMQSSHGGQEPPHKRARSEVFPSPMVGQHASRPATSYETMNAWNRGSAQQPHPTGTYDSRVEEAALLLNFRTGGAPTSRVDHVLPAPEADSIHAVPRPHANSFPQDAHHARPVDLAPQPDLLPPFMPQGFSYLPPAPPSQQALQELHSKLKPETHILPSIVPNPAVSRAQVDADTLDAPRQMHSPLDDETSRAPSTDVATSEVSESTAKTKRGWPKGKSRASTGRKSVAGKTASRRGVSRKKTPDSSKRSKVSTPAVGEDWNIRPELNRRKSFSDAQRRQPEFVPGPRAESVAPDIAMVIKPAAPRKPSRKVKEVASDIICAGCETVRETYKLNPELDEWVCCNGCKKWFHLDCAGFKKASEVRDVDKYFCAACEPTHGKTTYVRKSTRAHASVDYAELQRGVLKTSEEDVEHHYIQPIKDGTFQFDQESFPRMRPELVTREFFERSGTFIEPICIPAAWNPRPWLEKGNARQQAGQPPAQDSGDISLDDLEPSNYEYDTVKDVGQDRLGMVMPENLTVRQVCNLAGPYTPLDVIDVKTQNSGQKWTLARWADYYEEVGDDKPIRNVISLEVSQTKLGRLLRRPQVVRDIDLQDEVWPQEEKDKGKWPKVQFYCLMSVADSYTDFHIDFGGSSVYYHILKGRKTFFFIPPKAKHLKAYEDWNDSPQQNYTFLPSITKECYRVDLYEGDTMLIPSGWIHAVWTPETSLVIGGNFLTRMSFQNQFKVVEIEKANETPMKFRYPSFQKIMWYTALKYLRDDPLPEAVSQAFYEGKRYARETPIWADFDGDIAANDDRPGSRNARYYSQAEMDGLPELANFIFRTVMLVMGRIEGITQDRIKRVNASIPKGHGEPLEIAKTFALWVAWKRGNEDIPAWAHPDAVLPNSKDETPKKLSARALKDMERKEAIAAYRQANPKPRRQRTAAPASGDALHFNPIPQSVALETPNRAMTFTAPSSNPSQQHINDTQTHQNMAVQAPSHAPPMALMMSGPPGHYLSTPKTSVLGPKRVACDVCRKRRIRCKHKDLVMQATPEHLQQLSPNGYLNGHHGQEIEENIVVAPPKTNHLNAPDSTNATPMNGIHGSGPFPGTNAYVNANIPMTVNGIAMFGDAGKRGRTKACFECRKSKRRCVHDENGNVDPVKAAETPIPRGSAASRKRTSETDGSPVQVKKKQKSSSPSNAPAATPAFHQNEANGQDSPHHSLDSHDTYPNPSQVYANADESTRQHEDQTSFDHRGSHAPIDPSLFAYAGQTEHHGYGFGYSAAERAQATYSLPSLEQIANEVLDMNEDYQHNPQENIHVYNPSDIGMHPHGLSKAPPQTDESVDSAISLPASEPSESKTEQAETDGQHREESMPQPSVETIEQQTAATAPEPIVRKSSVSELPLYRPPAPLSASPELSRRQPHLPNGTARSLESSKRKRDSTSGRASSTSDKKPNLNGNSAESKQQPVIEEEDRDSVELARALQADDNGLRRRTSR